MSSRKLLLPIAEDHPAFAGHFPGKPIVPGVVLLDEALHAIGLGLGKNFSACRITTAKFLSPAKPGELLEVEFTVSSTGAIDFSVMCGERKIATGSVRQFDASAGPQ